MVAGTVARRLIGADSQGTFGLLASVYGWTSAYIPPPIAVGTPGATRSKSDIQSEASTLRRRNAGTDGFSAPLIVFEAPVVKDKFVRVSSGPSNSPVRYPMVVGSYCAANAFLTPE